VCKEQLPNCVALTFGLSHPDGLQDHCSAVCQMEKEGDLDRLSLRPRVWPDSGLDSFLVSGAGSDRLGSHFTSLQFS
jgi:hypothetical protein